MKNCGGCNQPCPSPPAGATGLTCKSSVCACDGTAAKCSTTSGPVCVQTSKDPRFCGASCTKCPDGQGCSNGQCVLPACAYGMTFSSIDNKCHYMESDASFCGTNPPVQCDPGDPLPPEQCCSGQCSSTGCPLQTNTDPANCGSFGNACKPGEACLSGVCKALPLAAEPWECPAGTKACAMPANWPTKPAPYYCWTSCVAGG